MAFVGAEKFSEIYVTLHYITKRAYDAKLMNLSDVEINRNVKYCPFCAAVNSPVISIAQMTDARTLTTREYYLLRISPIVDLTVYNEK